MKKNIIIAIIIFLIFLVLFSCTSTGIFTKKEKKEEIKKESISKIEVFLKENFTDDEKIEIIYIYAKSLYIDGMDKNNIEKILKAKVLFKFLMEEYKYKNSSFYFKKIVNFINKKIEYYNRQIKLYKSRNNRYMMAVYYKKLLILLPDNKKALKFLADNKTYLENQIKKFIETGNVLLKKNDLFNAKMYFEWVLLFDYSNKIAIEKIKLIKNKIKELANIYFKKGLNYYKSNNYEKAKKYFNLSLKYGYENSEKIQQFLNQIKNKMYIETLYESFVKYYENKDFVKAKELLHKIMDIDDNFKDIKKLEKQFYKDLYKYIEKLYKKAIDYYYNEKYKEALQYFKWIKSLISDYEDIDEYISRCEDKLETL